MILAPTRDAEAMSRVHGRSFDAPWAATEISALLDGPGVFALAAHLDDGLAAFILCRAAADEAEILTLAVSPEHRRCGVAAALVEAGVATAQTLGAITVFLEVAVDNEPALKLYAKHEFRPAGRRDSYYSRGLNRIDALVLRRDLNRASVEPYD